MKDNSGEHIVYDVINLEEKMVGHSLSQNLSAIIYLVKLLFSVLIIGAFVIPVFVIFVCLLFVVIVAWFLILLLKIIVINIPTSIINLFRRK